MRWKAITLAAMLVIPAAAQAEQIASNSMFGVAPVGDQMLAGMRGGESPFAKLTRATAGRIVDDQARLDLRLTGENARIQMDVWWGSIGSELVANSVRAAGAP